MCSEILYPNVNNTLRLKCVLNTYNVAMDHGTVTLGRFMVIEPWTFSFHLAFGHNGNITAPFSSESRPALIDPLSLREITTYDIWKP